MDRYTQPGKYVAICRGGRSFDQPVIHYVKVFDFPKLEDREKNLLARSGYEHLWNKITHMPEELALLDQAIKISESQDAAWWFLNRVDVVALLEAVYPLHIFKQLLPELEKGNK